MAWLLTWLVHGLAIALVTRFALRALPGLSAATRYAMWWAALVLVLILPIVRGLAIGAGAGAQASAIPVASTSPSASSSPSSSSSKGDFAAGETGAASVTRVTSGSAQLLQSFFQSFSLPPVALPRVPDWFMSIVIGLWLGCAMVGLAQVAYSVQTVRRLKESCRRLAMPRESDLPMWSAVRDLGRAVEVRASDRVRTAAVLGLTRPVIAVPRDAAAALTPHEIDQVVLHEYAHVQRYDDWTKLLQVLIGAFAGWHPAVRLMMREIDFEREAACDDYVVDVTGAPRAYARCLTKVIEMMPGSSLDLAAVPHAYSSASHATTRIERLLDRKRPSGRLAVMPAMAGSLTLAVLALCTVHALPIATDHPRAGATLASAAAAAGGAVAASDHRATIALDTNVAVAEDVDSVNRVDVNGVDVNGVNDDARRENAPSPVAARGRELRIAVASTLPISLPFPRFSPLSGLTNAQPAASRATPVPAAAPARVVTSPASSTPGLASASTSAAMAPSIGLARADRPVESNAATVGPNANAASTSATPTAAASLETRHVRDNRSGAGTGRPHPTSDLRDMRDATPPHAEATFALGPVIAAGDSDAMPEAADAGHIERAWENTRDATSKAMGVSARAVDSATKTAGKATKTATNKAAAGMKVGGTQTMRAIGRVKRTLASVF